MNTTQLTAPARRVPLRELIAGLADPRLGGLTAPQGATDPIVSGITLDSRRVRPGDLYVALPGTRAHGAQFAASAVESGAVAVLTDAEGAELAAASGLPVVIAERPRIAMAALAARFHADPTAGLRMFGITGTNGKTTTAFLVEAGLLAAGHRVGTLGTVGFRLDGEPVGFSSTTVTTPESNDLQALLAALRAAGATDVVMEVSSHALALERVHAVDFDVVGFTHLGRDHLDFHPTMEDYFEAKASLFAPGRSRAAVVVVVDEWGAELARRVRTAGSPRLVTIADQDGPWADEADVVITGHASVPGGGRVSIRGALGERTLDLDLPGEHNGRNAVLALAMLDAAGLAPDTVTAGLAHAQVPGRMQRVRLPGDAPTVLVDFAHTPQAIASALATGEDFARTLVVIGAGGDRDRAKRPLMGAAAAAGADVVLVTDDNPRTEDPAAIRAEVLAGAEGPGARARVIEVGDRGQAIEQGLRLAGPDDLLLVLGKGHETGQLVGDQVLPFDDVETVQRAWGSLQDSPPGEDH